MAADGWRRVAAGRAVGKGSAGFTLVELTVGLLILGLLAGVLVPEVLGRLRSGQAATLANALTAVNEALIQFRTDVGRYPAQLVHLTTPPPTGADDTCGRDIPNVTGWNGPYMSQQLTTAGIRSGTSTIQNAIVRSPATFSATGTMFVTVLEVDEEVAEALERSFDTTTDYASGTIRWTAGGSGQGTLTYAVPIRGC